MGILAGAVVAVAGWLVGAHMARRAARRTLRIGYLLSAYRRLESASNRRMTSGHEAALEAAVSDIQLLGPVGQVRLAREFATEFTGNGTADTGRLLEDVRSSLRAELQLEPVPARLVFLRLSGDRAATAGSGGERSGLDEVGGANWRRLPTTFAEPSDCDPSTQTDGAPSKATPSWTKSRLRPEALEPLVCLFVGR